VRLSRRGATIVEDDDVGNKVLNLNGFNGFASIPATRFQRSDFTIDMWFKSSENGKRQTLLGDWYRPWQFIIFILPDGKISVHLRRNINSGGSNRNQDLLDAIGGSVTRDEWHHLIVTYSHGAGTCVVYLDCETVASVTTKWPDHDLQVNDHQRYFVGYKSDSRSDFFKGRIGSISISDEWTNDIAPTRFEYDSDKDAINWYSSGVSFTEDEELELEVMTFDGVSGYALIPAIQFQKSDFSIEVDFKSLENGKRQTIIADWSHPWQFIVYILPDGRISVTLRRNINSGGGDRQQDLITAIGGSVTRDQWQNLLVSYSHDSGTCTVYLNDDEVAEVTTDWPDHDLQENDHPSYELGYKKDSNSEFFKGSIATVRITKYTVPGRRGC